MSATKEFHHNKIEQEQRKTIADSRDYPILFDTEMVRAILSGAKTETRRLFKSPLSGYTEEAEDIFFVNGEWIAKFKHRPLVLYPIVCPYGEPGDYLWVKETWAPALGEIAYKADYSKNVLSEERNKGIWKPSIHMSKTAARTWLQITDVKPQRIQTITEEEARWEGTKAGKIYWSDKTNQSNFREGFIIKWISIYGIESYYENPWVWTIKFTVTDSKPSITL